MSRWAPIAAALLGAAAIAVLLVGLLATGDITVAAPVLVGELGLVNVNNSPAVVRNPANPRNVVVVNRVDRPGFSASVNASTDGGDSWTTAVPPLPVGKDRPFAPSAAFGPDGTLYVTYVNLVGQGNRPENLWITASNNGGRSFSEPVRVTGEHPFQAQLTVDPTDGTLHVTWLQAEELALLSFPGRPRILTARSSDGGRTWSEPVQVSDQDRERVGAAVPVVTASGDLVVVYRDFKGDRRDFQNLDGPAWDQPFALVAARSTDGGRTFTEGLEFESDALPTRRFLPFLPEFPGVATAGDDDLYVTWADGRNGDLDVFLRRSVDGGRTWADPGRVNDNELGDGTSQYLPQVDVAPGGRVDVLYLDRRDDPTDVLMRASLAFSRDGGERFRSLTVSPTAFDSRIGASAAPHLETDFGSRLGLSSGRDGALVAWTDTTLGDQTSGRQDVATRLVSFPDPPVRRSTAAATAAVLLVAGAGLLVWWWRRSVSPRPR